MSHIDLRGDDDYTLDSTVAPLQFYTNSFTSHRDLVLPNASTLDFARIRVVRRHTYGRDRFFLSIYDPDRVEGRSPLVILRPGEWADFDRYYNSPYWIVTASGSFTMYWQPS